MADDDPGPRRPGPSQKSSWSNLLKRAASGNTDGGGNDEAAESPKAPATGGGPVSRPSSHGATSFRAGIPRATSSGGHNGTGAGTKDAPMVTGGLISARTHSVVHAGLLAPGQGNGTTADVVTAVKDLQLRKRSIMFQQVTSQTGPSLQTRTGCLSTYFFAPNPTPGKGVSFSPDGAYVMRWGYGTDVKLLSADDGVLVVTMMVPTPGVVRYATFNSDGGKLAVSTEDCKVYVWITANKHLISMLDVGLEPLAHVVFSRDSKHLLSSDDEGQLELWNIQTASMVRRYETGHISKRCGFTGDGNCVMSCAGEDCGLVLLDTRSGCLQLAQAFEEVAESRNRASYVISPDGTKVLLFVMEQVYGINLVLYHVDTDTHIPMMVCNGAVTHAEFSNDSSLFVTAGRDDLIHVWESDTGMLRTTLQGHASDVMFCKISEDGEVAVSGDSEGTVLVWSLADSACVMRLQAHSSPIAYVDINSDGTRALTVDTEGHALLWFLDAARIFEVMRQHSDLVCCVAPTPDGSSLIVGYKDGCLRCWNVCDGPGLAATVTWTQQRQTCPVEQLEMRPDGSQVASAGRDGTVMITDARRGVVIAVLNAHNDFVTGLLFSERSDLLVTASRVGEVFVWNARAYGNEPLHQLEVPELMEVAHLAISPNQAFLAAATAGGSVHVWSLTTFTLQSDVKVTDLPATRLTFNLDASVLAVGSADGSVTLVDPLTGIRAAYYKGNASSISDVAFLKKPEHMLLSLCGRQIIKWDCHKSAIHHVTDFIADNSRIFSTESIGTIPNRTCVAHDAVVLYDPINHAAMFDMLPRPPEQHPGNSYLFRHGTALTYGSNKYPMVLFCAPDTTVHMLSDETGGTRCLDFSSDGRLLVSGTLRGELCVWDVVHQQSMHKWVAHKRYAITCVRFTHDATSVYSCAEDCKVIMWDWRRQTKVAVLVGHQAPVQAVEMSVDGSQMASGDRDGFIFIWDTETHSPKQVIPAHDGFVLCCSLSPCGTMVASTGADEHIVILDVSTGQQLASLDDAMDGKGLTIKFSFDGTRLLVGGEKGSVLIWDVSRNCLLYDIPAHDGKVFDCGWSGDSRRLLSVGSDGRARLWDAAAGSELCQANFDRVMGAVESGGFVHCDLSATGNRMAGCTAKGQLIDWDVGAELRCVPEGSMLYQRLSALSVGRSREVYARLLHQFPLLPNTQDSRGWTILMHAVANSNPEITKLIINSVPTGTGKLGLTASAVQNSILSSIRHVPRVQMHHAASLPVSQKGLSAIDTTSKRASHTAAGGANVAKGMASKKLKVLEGKGDVDAEDEDEDDESDVRDSGSAAVALAPEGTLALPPVSPNKGILFGPIGNFLRADADIGRRGRECMSQSDDGGLAPTLAGGLPEPIIRISSARLRSTTDVESEDVRAQNPSLIFGPDDQTAAITGARPPATSLMAGGCRVSILKSAGRAHVNPSAQGGATAGNSIILAPAPLAEQSNSPRTAASTGTASNAPSTNASAGGAASNGGSAHGGNLYGGGVTYSSGRRSLLGSVLEAERERDNATRSRRRSFMFGPGVMPYGGGGVSGPTQASSIATTQLGRSIRYAMNRLARSSANAGTGSARDVEEAGPPQHENNGVEVRHVSDLSRGGWQEEDHDHHRGTAGGAAAPKDSSVGQQTGQSGRSSNRVWPEPQSPDRTEPNAVKIALDAGAADCVQHVLDAVLAQKVTPGSYHAITAAIPAVAQQYPTMCQVFLSGLPLRPLGEMEVPSSIAARGMIVTSAPSYTSYKEMWMNELQLGGGNKGPMALMEACMVRLPFAAASGKTSVLHTLVESSVPVQTFGSDTVKAIVDYKWRNFAQRRIYVKALVYLLYTVIFTVFAILFADDESDIPLRGTIMKAVDDQVVERHMFDTGNSVAMVVFAVILFLYGIYFLVLEIVQLVSLGIRAYFDSFWNIVDIAAYVTTLIVCPCTVFRVGIHEKGFVPVLVAAEVIMLWVKVLFYGLAIDGVGTFIFMTAEIIKGLKYFIGLLATLFISFAVAFMVLFRTAEQDLGTNYGNFGKALLNVYLVMFQLGDPLSSLDTEYGNFAILLFCVYMFALIVVMLNMIITLMADIFQKVKGVQHFVFLKGRAELIIDVESTTGASLVNDDHPYLHLLLPLRKEGGGAELSADEKLSTAILARGPNALPATNTLPIGGGMTPHAVSLSGGMGRNNAAEGASGSGSDDEDGRSIVGGGNRLASRAASFKSVRSFAVGMGATSNVRRPTEGYNALGGMTMGRGRHAATAAPQSAGVDMDRLERLERAVNRLSINLDSVMAHLRVRRPSASGGFSSQVSPDVPILATPNGRRTSIQRSAVTGVGGRVAGGSFGPMVSSNGVPTGRPTSRPTSALAVMTRPEDGAAVPPPAPPVVSQIGMPGAVGGMPTATTSSDRLGSAPQPAGSHGHHATFADQFGSFLAVVPGPDAGAGAPRTGSSVSPAAGSSAGVGRASQSGGTSPSAGATRIRTPDRPGNAPVSGGGGGGAAANARAEGGTEVASSRLPAASGMRPTESVPVEATAPRMSSGRGSTTSEPSPVRSPTSANAATGGVVAAARLVLDPEEPPAWSGTGPGRPSGSGGGSEPQRLRTPGEVEPTS